MDRFLKPCECPKPKKALPESLRDAAFAGRYSEIQAYLEKGGDVNASCNMGWTLLNAASWKGRSRVVQKLLTRHGIHLNVFFFGGTPLSYALDNDNADCVEVLLQSAAKCQINLNESWSQLLTLKPPSPVFWFDIINKVASYFDIEKMAEAICHRNNKFVLDAKLTQAAGFRNVEAVAEILASKEDINNFLDGTLIAVSSMGTSEDVARLLIRHPYEYEMESVETSLTLSTMNNNLSIIPLLLQRFFSKLSYDVLCSAQEAAAMGKHTIATKLLDKAIVVKCKNMIFYSKPLKVGGLHPNPVSEESGNPSTETPLDAIELGVPALEATGSSEIPRLSDLAKETLTVTENTAKVSGTPGEDIDTIMEKLVTKGSKLDPDEGLKLLRETVHAQEKVAEVLTQIAEAAKITHKALSMVSNFYSTRESLSNTSEDS